VHLSLGIYINAIGISISMGILYHRTIINYGHYFNSYNPIVLWSNFVVVKSWKKL